jgi:hypothetical protein
MYFEHVRDIKDAYQKVRGITTEAEKTAAMEKWFSTDLPEVSRFNCLCFPFLCFPISS